MSRLQEIIFKIMAILHKRPFSSLSIERRLIASSNAIHRVF